MSKYYFFKVPKIRHSEVDSLKENWRQDGRQCCLLEGCSLDGQDIFFFSSSELQHEGHVYLVNTPNARSRLQNCELTDKFKKNAIFVNSHNNYMTWIIVPFEEEDQKDAHLDYARIKREFQEQILFANTFSSYNTNIQSAAFKWVQLSICSATT